MQNRIEEYTKDGNIYINKMFQDLTEQEIQVVIRSALNYIATVIDTIKDINLKTSIAIICYDATLRLAANEAGGEGN